MTRASGHVTFTNATLAEFSATARGRIDVDEWGTMDVDGRLARDGDTWHFDALTLKRPDAPGHLTWVGDFIVAADEPARFAGRAEWVQMAWPLDVRDPAVRSTRGTARAEGTFDDYRLVVDGTFAFPNVPAGRWQGTARGNRTQLVAETLEGRVLGGRVAGRGRVKWKPAIAWSLDATAYGIDPHATYSVVPAALSGGSWRIVGHGDERAMVVESLRVDNPQGALIASGGFAWEPSFTWHADATTRGISPAALFPEVPAGFAGGDWHVVGRGTDARAELSRVEGAFLGGMVDASGTVAWEPAVSWSLAGNVRNLDPSRAYEGWNGNLSGAFRTHGETVRGQAVGEVLVENVTGTLRDRELTAHGTVVLREGTVSLAGVEGAWGPARLALSGEISPRLGLGFDVRELDIATLDPRAAGVVTARGTVRGEPTAPVVDATLAGTGVGWTTHRAAKLEGRFALDLAPGGTVDVDLTASDLRIGAEKIDAMSLQAKGTREAHTITVATRGAEGSFELAASGGFPSGSRRERADHCRGSIAAGVDGHAHPPRGRDAGDRPLGAGFADAGHHRRLAGAGPRHVLGFRGCRRNLRRDPASASLRRPRLARRRQRPGRRAQRRRHRHRAAAAPLRPPAAARPGGGRLGERRRPPAHCRRRRARRRSGACDRAPAPRCGARPAARR